VAFPASNGSIPFTLEAAWKAARDTAAQIQATCGNLTTQIGSNACSAQTIANATSFLANLNVLLTQYGAVPGLAAYAQAQINNSNENIVADFNAMQTALVAVVAWVVANFPTDGSAMKFNANGQLVWATFTSAQLAPLQTLVTALSATIN
jgi:hypothetical protein